MYLRSSIHYKPTVLIPTKVPEPKRTGQAIAGRVYRNHLLFLPY